MTECFRLLKAMMNLNPEERITPVDVLTHPFILRGYYPWANDYNSNNSDSESDSENCKVAKTVRDKFYLNHLNYEIMEKLGRKCFGPIRKCWNHQTGEYVAVKRPLNWPCSSYEMMLLKELLDEGCELHNIVKCHGWFDFLVGKAPVFELLDKDIGSILKESQKPMLLSDIRVIIQQMAEALLFLKERKIIHCNITPHHIMTVDEKRPLRVKLIDFGFATYSNDRDGVYATGIQSPCYSAPEMILDYPQSAATDMWSLGCVMAEMVLGKPLFPEDPDDLDSDDSYRDDSDSEDCGPGSNTAVLAQMVKYLGMPPDHVIDEGGVGSNLYFRKTTSNKWIHREFPQENSSILLPTGQSLKSLDDLKSMRLEDKNGFEAVEREQCIELLKAMLRMDPKKRITPDEVLNHPFIKTDHKPATCSEPASLLPDHSSLPLTLLPLDVTMEKMEEEKKKTKKWFLLCFSRKKNISPPGVTMEKMERKKEEKKKTNCFLLCCTKKKKITPSDIVMVPAGAPQVDHDNTRSQEDHDCPPAATLPPGVIMVQPAPPERRFTTVNEGRPGSLQAVPHMVYTSQSETEKIYSLTPVRV
ncbi:homeodomain-interacting protein kinase 2-like isoform X2 [Antennarius striatus]|uniref:homeodomain-interacting protein kinase 2-like isoform X2 n=1 Tax=Antennarius striatus TaxID=241820 RepID=UPI0035B1890A